ncbi:MAG: plasmid stability protein [Synechococcaceae cyanobacterium SM1_2_3]|nr:plasmid stability protein [Synechococcaceae cyanobacterium SM1_2_3]
MTVRNLPDEIHRAIWLQAAQHGRSTEAEIRDILARSVRPEGRLCIGAELRRYAAQIGGVELEIRRDATPIEPAIFE